MSTDTAAGTEPQEGRPTHFLCVVLSCVPTVVTVSTVTRYLPFVLLRNLVNETLLLYLCSISYFLFNLTIDVLNKLLNFQLSHEPCCNRQTQASWLS